MEWAERSLAIDGKNPDTLYNVACGYAQLGEAEHALDNLEQAGLRGVMIAEWAENDSDLEPLRDLPRFRAVLDSIRANEAARNAAAPGKNETGLACPAAVQPDGTIPALLLRRIPILRPNAHILLFELC